MVSDSRASFYTKSSSLLCSPFSSLLHFVFSLSNLPFSFCSLASLSLCSHVFFFKFVPFYSFFILFCFASTITLQYYYILCSLVLNFCNVNSKKFALLGYEASGRNFFQKSREVLERKRKKSKIGEEGGRERGERYFSK